MDLLLKGVTIVEASSSFDGQIVDILLQGNQIKDIGPSLAEDEAQVVSLPGLCCSAGWFDLVSFSGEPGYEHRETLEAFKKAAAFGGFTEVGCLPHVNPITQSKAAVELFRYQSKDSFVHLHAIAAVTHDLDGKDLSEIIDLKNAGAIAFSDGAESLQAEGTVLKALEYLKLVNGVLINQPENKKVASGGQMHEGLASTRLGLKGIPSIAEEMQVARDLQLLRYIGGKLHLTQLSTAAGVHAVRKAKQEGLQVTCDVAAHQCAFTDETIEPFDSNYKVSPPFRSEADRAALLQGLQDGTIDAIVSAHTPWHEEAKELEFDLAEAGIIGLQTAFSVACGSMASHISWREVVEKVTVGSRKIVGLPLPVLAKGESANLTFFDPTKSWVFDQAVSASAAKNSPFFGQTLQGCVYGTFLNGQLTLNPAFASQESVSNKSNV